MVLRKFEKASLPFSHRASFNLRAQGGFLVLAHRSKSNHYFLCIEVTDDETYWVPLSSKSGEHRIPVPFSQKRGREAWVKAPTFALARQFWGATRSAIIEAADVAMDNSGLRDRNCVLPTLTEQIALAVREAPLF